MSTTTRETAGRRQSKVYASNTISKSSKTSLLSVFTVSSAGSGDSNNTITQNSYDQSRRKKRKRPKGNCHRHNEPLAKKENMSIDVFDFLVDGNGSSASLCSSPPTHEPTLVMPVEKIVVPETEESDESSPYTSSDEEDGIDEFLRSPP